VNFVFIPIKGELKFDGQDQMIGEGYHAYLKQLSQSLVDIIHKQKILTHKMLSICGNSSYVYT
jgi:hypothetical protein